MANLSQERLPCWLTSSEGVEPDDVGVKIDLSSDEPVRPVGVKGEGASQEGGCALVARTPQEDDAPLRAGLGVEGPLCREWAASWGTVDAGGRPAVAGGDELGRLDLKGFQGVMMEARPDLRLPAAIEVLNGGLKAGLAGGDEHRHHPEAQTDPGDLAQGVGRPMRPLEAGVVVELGVGRHPDLAPVRHEGVDREGGGDRGPGPGGD